MSMITTDDALVVRPSLLARLSTICMLLVIVGVYVLAGVFGVLQLPLVVFFGLVFGAPLAIALSTAARSRRTPWELRLDAAGLSVWDRGSVPWSDIVEVTVLPLQPGRWHRLSLGYRVVAFVGRPGVVLPSLPSTDLPGPLGRWAERRRLKMVGTLLIVPPAWMDATPAQLEAAVNQFSDVPVVHRIASHSRAEGTAPRT
jgi:hypothetical protein